MNFEKLKNKLKKHLDFVQNQKQDSSIQQTLQDYIDELYEIQNIQQESQKIQEQCSQLKIQNQEQIQILDDSFNILLNAQEQVDKLTYNIMIDNEFSCEQILDYALFIQPNLQAIKNNVQEIGPFPLQSKLQKSLSNYHYKNYQRKCEEPIVKPIEENTNQVKFIVRSQDNSSISYTTDGTYPSAFLGTNNEGFQDDFTHIIIDQTCQLKVICYKPNHQESDVVELDITIKEDGTCEVHGAVIRPEEELFIKWLPESDTPFDTNSFIQTPNLWNQTPG